MSVFGKLDAATIPTNPFWIEKGEYEAEVTKAEYKKDRDGNNQLFFEYTIDQEESQFNKKKASQFFTLVDPEMTAEDFELLPATEKAKISRTNSALKRTLCGNDANDSQQGLGVDADDLNDEDWDPSVLVGRKINMGIANYGAKDEGVNVRWVNLRD
jgi:hypothetical protein